MNAGDVSVTGKGGQLWQRFVVAIPYLWLLLFFLAPFAIVFKISFPTR
ncbi:MAG: hypothetical protein U5K38_12800 [Woeseiaceae bacterium]|nr:hypothetical protein [Woeseiaceae bacterium]